MKKCLLLLFVLFSFYLSHAQTSMMDSLTNDSHASQKVSGAFKSTRVINAHSVEMLGKGNLDFRILHRFGYVNTGAKQFWGFDNATMRLGFDYGLTNNLMIGIGRSTFRKEVDGFIKYRLLQQSTGYKSKPVSLVLAAGTMYTTEPSFAPVKPKVGDRNSWYTQLLIGRKFNPKFSFQLSPMLIHSNLQLHPADDDMLFVWGFGGRYKFSKRMAFTFDYHHAQGSLDSSISDPLSVGVDIETGGHVFQLHFTNAAGMNERAYIYETTGKFFKGDIRFGFNLSRIFKLGNKKKVAPGY